MLKNNKVLELQQEIIGLKQLLEQESLRADKAERYIENLYPSVGKIEIKTGWHDGSGTVSTYKVSIEVWAEDLKNIISFLTNKKLPYKKWDRMHSDVKERIKQEVMEELKNGQGGLTDE